MANPYSVKCPSCGSEPGKHCYGCGDMPYPHAERRAAALAPDPNCIVCAALAARVAELEKQFEHGGELLAEEQVYHLETQTALEQEQVKCVRFQKALESIRLYGNDTLSGPINCADDTRDWQRQAVREMRNRARAALTPMMKPCMEDTERDQQRRSGTKNNSGG